MTTVTDLTRNAFGDLVQVECYTAPDVGTTTYTTAAASAAAEKGAENGVSEDITECPENITDILKPARRRCA